MRIAAPALLACAVTLAACSAEEDLASGPDAAALIGTYEWVSSSFSAGGPPIVQTPESTGESRAIVFAADSLVYVRGSNRERALAYTLLGDVSLRGYDGLAVRTSGRVAGSERYYTLATDLRDDGTLVVFPIDPICTEGCSDVYARIEE